MSHLPDTGNKVSDTPSTDAEAFYPHDSAKKVCDADLARELERELRRACQMYSKLDLHCINLIDRIQRLEKAGDKMEKLLPEGRICDEAVNQWRKAKEAKP